MGLEGFACHRGPVVTTLDAAEQFPLTSQCVIGAIRSAFKLFAPWRLGDLSWFFAISFREVVPMRDL